MVRTVGKLMPILIGLLFMAAVVAPSAIAQENTTPPHKPPVDGSQPAMYSGTVVEMSEGKITVSRTVLSNPEKRTFMMNPDTKVEGKLKPKCRVTVRYRTQEDGYLAVTILVRDNTKKK